MPSPIFSCVHCGRICPSRARFCGGCGARLTAGPDDVTAEYQLPAVVATTAREAPDRQPDQAPPLSRPLAPDQAAEQWPAGIRIGPAERYWIEAMIGEGGFGQVYLARDTRLDRLCVVKRLITTHQSRNLLALIDREARLLITLNSPGHPHIPEIYDYVADQHALVMKYIAGQSLAQLVTEQGGRLDLQTALRYCRDVCAALVYMHEHPGEVVLHRDIKPGNILLDTSGRIWLIDFGLARLAVDSLDPSQLSETDLAGTLGYTPPEQWRGQAEARSDVYALGATLYVLVSGYIPERSTLLQLARGDLSYPPIRQIVPEINPSVERLLLRALAPEPALRPSAAELLAELESIIRAAELPPPPEPEQPPVVEGFVGREYELVAALSDLERDGFVLFCGMAGLGKTSLAAMLARRSARPGRLFWHNFRAGPGGDRLIWALAGFLAHHGHHEVWRQLQIVHAGHEPPREQLLAYLTPLLRGGSYTLVLDDLHLAAGDRLVEILLARLLAEARAGQLRLVITSRHAPPLLEHPPPLAGLGLDDSRALLASRGLQLDDEQAARLYRLTEGNAQLLLLTIEALRRGADPQRLTGQLAETPDVERYLLREVDGGLNQEERDLMEAISALLGYSGSRAVIEAMLGRDGVRRTLVDLVDRNLLTFNDGAAGRIYNQHAIIQRFYYDGLGKQRRSELHRRAAAHYQHSEPDSLAAVRHLVAADKYRQAAELATTALNRLINAGQARALGELLDHLPIARLELQLAAMVRTAQGEIAALLGQFSEARSWLEQALALDAELEADHVRLEAQARRRRLLAMIGEQTGEYAQAEADCRDGLTLALSLGLPNIEAGRLYGQLALVLLRRGRLEAAEQFARSGLAALPPLPQALRERAELLVRLGTLAGERGYYATAVNDLEDALTLARQADAPMVVGAALTNLGAFLSQMGEEQRAIDCYNESLSIVERLGNVDAQVSTLINLALTLLGCGNYSEALAHLDAAHTISERLGLRQHLLWVLVNTGAIALMERRLDEANDILQQARCIAEELGDQQGRADIAYRLGDVALAQGRHNLAEQYATEALEHAGATGSLSYQSCAWRVLGEAVLAHGDLEQAGRHLVRAERLQQEVGDPFDQALISVALARLALARNAQAEALAILERAALSAGAYRLEYPLRVIDELRKQIKGG